ncbi:M20/M25/M40 family metallo-hydrolase [Sinorhizobium medicae]|uniref:M20/M25/M40 family metallo-hydrolase n=1 Tax=Sinorhizobium medicae TaxID=110321 RepID=UPI0034E94F32
MRYRRHDPVTFNHTAETNLAIKAACSLVGTGSVNDRVKPQMGSEDFAYVLEARPGAFIFLGNGATASAGRAIAMSARRNVLSFRPSARRIHKEVLSTLPWRAKNPFELLNPARPAGAPASPTTSSKKRQSTWGCRREMAKLCERAAAGARGQKSTPCTGRKLAVILHRILGDGTIFITRKAVPAMAP